MNLQEAFLTRPLAHRGFHGAGRPENSRASFVAAIEAGYGIELDLQLSSDGEAMVFHDYRLNRLTGETGRVDARTSAELGEIQLSGGEEGIPTLAEVLDLVEGRAPLLIEIKDQDGALGPDVGALEAATVRALQGYPGEFALMSFNPHSVAEVARLMPEAVRGLTTCHFPAQDWADVPDTRRAALARIEDYDRVGASFISHQASDLSSARVNELRAQGAAILTWTIRSPEEEAIAREVAHNVTFEGYAAPLA